MNFISIINTIKRKINILKYPKKGDTIIVLVPFSNVINGGHLSIDNIYKTIKKHHNIHKSNVLLSYVFLTNHPNHTRFSMFRSSSFIQDWRTILSHFTSFDRLQIHIPESYIRFFVKEFHHQWPKEFKEKLLNAKHLSFNILNQNDEYMNIEDIDNLREICPNITMTLAHQKYTSQEKRNEYKVPLHHLSAWLNDGNYSKVKFQNKENIILYSPDEVKNTPEIKQEIISLLKQELPNFSIIEIKDISYEKYKNLISKAKYTITFGEGLDGYFIETALSGGISFAVYNEVFFTPNYKNLPTLYPSYDALKSNIVNHIKSIEEEEKYSNTNQSIASEIEKEYSFEIFENKLIHFLQNKLDIC